ncbi:MAG: hypothetical protein U5K56_05490 [Halioglobus sp.]|nr:hypothetical protein [Halioglobus sp.]
MAEVQVVEIEDGIAVDQQEFSAQVWGGVAQRAGRTQRLRLHDDLDSGIHLVGEGTSVAVGLFDDPGLIPRQQYKFVETETAQIQHDMFDEGSSGDRKERFGRCADGIAQAGAPAPDKNGGLHHRFHEKPFRWVRPRFICRGLAFTIWEPI